MQKHLFTWSFHLYKVDGIAFLNKADSYVSGWYNLAIQVKAEGPVKISHGSLRASRLQ
jgi:hypothetical protein